MEVRLCIKQAPEPETGACAGPATDGGAVESYPVTDGRPFQKSGVELIILRIFQHCPERFLLMGDFPNSHGNFGAKGEKFQGFGLCCGC